MGGRASLRQDPPHRVVTLLVVLDRRGNVLFFAFFKLHHRVAGDVQGKLLLGIGLARVALRDFPREERRFESRGSPG